MKTNTAVTAVPAATGPEEFLESLRGRYAVKKFDPSARIEPRLWNALEEALVLAPSSYGLQPWKFFVVSDPKLRAELQPASWGQSQIVDADKLVVFAARKGFGAADVERFVDRIAEVRGTPAAGLSEYKKMMLASLDRPQAEIDAWVARQVYIALGVFLTGAAALGVDACPMEGIDAPAYDRILGLAEKGYTALCVATAGARSPEDAYAGALKVRFARPEIIERL